MEELKPCPFCGGDGEVVCDSWTERLPVFICCAECGSTAPHDTWNARSLDRWIPVSEKLPNEHQKVDLLEGYDSRLVDCEYYDNGFYAPEQQWDTDSDADGTFSCTFLIEDVTHWMPTPPIEGK